MIYDYLVKDYKGNDISLDMYKGKVLLIVNTAIKCGYAKQYDELVELKKIFKNKEFEILDFPCNQFFKQSPLLGEENHEACVLRFAIDFPQFYRLDVNGKNEHPLYKYLKENVRDGSNGRIKWNFTKFLIDKEGNVIKRYEPGVRPLDIAHDIETLL